MKRYDGVIDRAIDEILDPHFPGWENDIDIETLDMVSCTNCMAGQIMGSFSKSSDYMGPNEDPADFGFSIGSSDVPDHLIELEWMSLRDSWVNRIKSRREANLEDWGSAEDITTGTGSSEGFGSSSLDRELALA